jgi:S1-C subfamily serine protease
VPWPAVVLVGLVVVAASAAAAVASEADVGSLRPDAGLGSLVLDPDRVPQQVRSAWQATVLVTQQALVGIGQARFRPETVGSGVILAVRDEGRHRVAVVATNEHVLRCTKLRCWPWVAFARTGSSRPTLWSRKVEILWQDASHDVAILSVRLPGGLEPAVAPLADHGCRTHAGQEVLAVGWPDLTWRTDWDGREPRAKTLRLKRFSFGRLVPGTVPQVVRAALGWDDEVDVFLHSADLLPGCSGGPVLDAEGHVLGLNTAVAHGPSVDDPYSRPCTEQAQSTRGERCAYVAIAADEIAAAWEKALGEPPPR